LKNRLFRRFFGVYCYEFRALSQIDLLGLDKQDFTAAGLLPPP